MAKLSNIKSNKGKLLYYAGSVTNPITNAVNYFARLKPAGSLDANTVNEWAAQFAKVTEAQMKAAFAALAEAIEYFTMNGHSVTLGDAGCFTFSSKTGVYDAEQGKWLSAARDSMDAVSAADIRAICIRYRPSTEMRSIIASVTLAFDGVERQSATSDGGNTGGGTGGSDPDDGSGLADPTISGTTPFATSTQVTITSSPGASIYYTTNGDRPYSDSTPYTGPFTLTETTTVRAIAFKDGQRSEVVDKTFTKSSGSGDPDSGDGGE